MEQADVGTRLLGAEAVLRGPAPRFRTEGTTPPPQGGRGCRLR
jgi:hypothetical protein